MKNSLKFFILMFYFPLNLFSQNNNEKKYIKEMKLFFQNAAEDNSWQAFLNYNDTFNLPEYFFSYKEYIDNQRKIKRNDNWYYFDPSTADNYNLNVSDFILLFISLLPVSGELTQLSKLILRTILKVVAD